MKARRKLRHSCDIQDVMSYIDFSSFRLILIERIWSKGISCFLGGHKKI